MVDVQHMMGTTDMTYLTGHMLPARGRRRHLPFRSSKMQEHNRNGEIELQRQGFVKTLQYRSCL